MKHRRHSNTKGYRQTKRDKCAKQVDAMSKRILGKGAK